MSVLTSNFAGGKNGKFFQIVPDYVAKELEKNPKLKPGMAKLPPPTAWDWVLNALLLKHVWASPNTIWGAIALAFYFAFPYDLSPTSAAAQAPLSWAFFAARFPLWFCVTFGYNLFWHVTLYVLDWAKRPFLENRVYNMDKVAHNIFWSTSGIAIWTAFDNVFAFLWSTGRLPYLSNEEAFASNWGIAKFVLGFMLVPLWREGHFYFAHRLLHFKPLYAMVHSLHHRNQDIEPFAGLSMHPIEHLYYFACIMPSLLPFASPFHFLWNGMHLLLSPGASHSGYEDHMQADAFHYLHHRYFECNYAGFGAAALDVYFGTFRENFMAKSVGEPLDKKDEDAAAEGKFTIPADAKSTLRAPPTFDFVLYLALATACLAAWAYAVCVPGALALLGPLTAQQTANAKLALSFLAGFGPVLVAMPWAGKAGGTSAFVEGKKADKGAFIPAAGFHWIVGSVVCSVPIMWATHLCF